MNKRSQDSNNRIPAFVACLVISLVSFSQVNQNQNQYQNYQNKSQVPIQNSTQSYTKKRSVSYSSPDLDSARYLADKSPLRAIEFLNKVIEQSIKLNDKASEGSAYLILGNIQQKLGQHDLAIENYRKCIAVYNYRSKSKKTSFNNTSEPNVFSASKQMAISYLELNNADKAEDNITNCLDFSLAPLPDLLSVKRLLAIVKLKQGRPEESISILTEVLAQEKQHYNVTGEIETYLSLGELYLQQKNDEKAEDYFTQAKMLAEKNNQPKLALRANDQLAKIFRKQKNVAKEIETRNSNIAINSNANNTQAVVKENIEIGNAYLNTNQMDKAQTYYDKGLTQFSSQGTATDIDRKLFIKSNDLDETAKTYKLLAEQYLKQKNPEKALLYFDVYARLQDSIKHVRQRELDEAINLSNSLGKNQQRIDLLEKERQLTEKSLEVLNQDKDLKEEQLDFKNTIIYVLMAFLGFTLLAGYFVIRSAKEKRRVNQLLALKSLRGQMNPHFIFNALNSVNHYISQNDERKANRYLSDFSKLMRMVMDSSKHSHVPVTEELDMLRLYLQLEHARFSDKFEYTFKVSDALNDSDFELPPMLIQPYIENAIWHGLRYLDHKGRLNLLFEEKNHELVVTISDNGIGRNKSMELKTLNQKKQLSIGMQNIENRIGIMNDLFNTNIRVEVTDAYPGEINCGTKVTLFIPQKK
jgi:LytS/YehU family sensor histidine kinase/Tfp pilus assembly protein PilF